MLEDADPDENVVDPTIKTKEDLTQEQLKEREIIIKGNHSEIKEGYQRLNDLVSSIAVPEPVFRDNRVYKLWAMAKKTDWSINELNSFKVCQCVT